MITIESGVLLFDGKAGYSCDHLYQLWTEGAETSPEVETIFRKWKAEGEEEGKVNEAIWKRFHQENPNY